MKLPKYTTAIMALIVAATFIWQMLAILTGHPQEYRWSGAMVGAFGWLIVALNDWKKDRAEQPVTGA